jgi:hypothetical protein
LTNDKSAWWDETMPDAVDLLEGKDDDEIDFLSKKKNN